MVTVSFFVKLKFYFSKLMFFFPKPRLFFTTKTSELFPKLRFFPQNPGFFSHNPTLRHTPQAILSQDHRSPPSDVQDGGSSKVIAEG